MKYCETCRNLGTDCICKEKRDIMPTIKESMTYKEQGNKELLDAFHNSVANHVSHDPDGVINQRCYDELLSRLNEAERLREIAQWFCDRVEKGEVRSKKTYTRFKQALTTPEGDNR